MPLTAQQVLQNRYEVVRSIKSGGMGAVYEARDRKLADSPCAIKEVLCQALAGPDAHYILDTFEKEMRALAGLEHPCIPRVRDYFEDEGRRYIVLDYVQGKPLDEELQEHLKVTGQPMDPHVAAMDMISVLETLSYLHGQKPAIVHRDIKPANLIRDERNGRIKLVDFGIARSVETQQVQTQVGTPGYCAPEQMAGRAETRSDLYSVGATLFQLVTGVLPPPFAFDALQPDLPRHPGLAQIISRATAVKPNERYASADEMARALRNWAQGVVASQHLGTGPNPAAQPAPPITPIHPLARPPQPSNSNQAALTVGLVSLLLASYALFPRSKAAPPVPTPSAVAAAHSTETPAAASTPAPLAASTPSGAAPVSASPQASPTVARTSPPDRNPPRFSGPAQRIARRREERREQAGAAPTLPDSDYPQGPRGFAGLRRQPVNQEAARPEEAPAAPPAAAGYNYAAENGLNLVAERGDEAHYRLPGQADFKVKKLAGRFEELDCELPRYVRVQGRAPRTDLPPRQSCYRMPGGYVHVKDHTVIAILPHNPNAADWSRIQNIVDNWPSN